MKKHLIIGFGTGRSGTTSLSAFLNAQERVRVLHEGRLDSKTPGNPFAWQGDEEKILSWIDQLFKNNQDFDWIGDIGMYYINYVDVILDRFPDTRFICMERPMKEVVRSYTEWTIGRNHWMAHDGTKWRFDSKWDKAYPKFEARNKKEALRLYWKSYTEQTQNLQRRLPVSVKVISLSDFNTPHCRDAILDFIQYTGVRKIDSRFIENTYAKKKKVVRSKILRKIFWSWKRKLVGSPGHRWFMKKRAI